MGELLGGSKFCSSKIIRISEPDRKEERLRVGARNEVSLSCSRGTRETGAEGGAPPRLVLMTFHMTTEERPWERPPSLSCVSLQPRDTYLR